MGIRWKTERVNIWISERVGLGWVERKVWLDIGRRIRLARESGRVR